MNDLEAVRREIAEDSVSADVELAPEDSREIDILLGNLSRDWAPSTLAIEALIADAPTLDFPAGHAERDRQRRQQVLAEARVDTPSIGSLLRRARGATAARTVADRAGIALTVWQLIEEDRAPAAVLNIEPGRLRRVARDIGMSPMAIAASLERSLADTTPSGFAFGYRPRQPVEEGEPLALEAADQTARVWTWLLAFLQDDV